MGVSVIIGAGTLWASSLLGSFAYNFSQPGVKTSVKLIHARYYHNPSEIRLFAIVLSSLHFLASIQVASLNFMVSVGVYSMMSSPSSATLFLAPLSGRLLY